MLPLRQRVWGLAGLLQLAQRQSQQALGCPAWLQQVAGLHASRDCCAAAGSRWGGSSGGGGDAGSSGGGGITGWLSSKLPSLLGGTKVEDLDIETFAGTLKQARRLGGLTGFVHGTAAVNDGQAQGTLRLFEHIIGAMTAAEKQDLQLFDAAARRRVATEVGATTNQVDDCIARYLWTRQLTQRVAALKKEGKEMPRSVDEVERMLGTWRQYKSEAEGADGSGGTAVPLDHVGYKGLPCPLAGMPVGKNTKCPASKKAFKACCGKTLRLGA